MEHNSLTSFYDALKDDLAKPDMVSKPMNVTRAPGGLDQSPGELAYRHKAAKCRDNLKDKCCKHILLDIYCKIIPLDKDYVDGHQGQMTSDIDAMLDKKGMNATQYLMSCSEATKAPLLEFILRSADNIGKTYMEEAEEELKQAQENDIPVAEPKEAETTDEEVSGQLVDIKNDMEYETFIDVLKKKTIDKIVADVSEIINNKKEEQDMTFNTEPPVDQEVAQESAVAVGMNYLNKHLMKENKTLTHKQQEEMIGLAIREATLHQFDVVFNQKAGEFKEFVSMIRYNKGVLINESVISKF